MVSPPSLSITGGAPHKRRKRVHNYAYEDDDDNEEEPQHETATAMTIDEDAADDVGLIQLQNALAVASPVILPPPWSEGCRGAGLLRLSITQDVGAQYLDPFIMLHDRICDAVPGGGATWGEADSHGEEDPRTRMYGFLPHQRQRLVEAGIRIQPPPPPSSNDYEMEDDNDDHADAIHDVVDQTEHERTLADSSVDLYWNDDGDDGAGHHDEKKTTTTASVVGRKRSNDNRTMRKNHTMSPTTTRTNSSEKKTPTVRLLGVPWVCYDALRQLTSEIQARAPLRYQPFLTMENLVCVQPNRHNGAMYLPAHLDFPRHDGFGVVIATVSIRHARQSRIILIDDGDDAEEQKTWAFTTTQDAGDCYVLMGNARNKCLHGVVAGDGRRESLNLRYGLHSRAFAHDEIDQYWPD